MPSLSRLAIVAVAAAGFGLTLWFFYPGIVTYDARYIYLDIGKGFYGDWQSPVMAWIWKSVDPIAPGSGSILILTTLLYWSAFLVLALGLAKRSIWLGLISLLLAFSPPAFALLGVIWRDILFAAIWLLAAVGVLAAVDWPKWSRRLVQALAFVLLGLGVLLRPNALAAAPLLGAYLLWPARFCWRRAAWLYVPLALALGAIVPGVYYGVFDAARQYPQHSILVFDLGGITHFSKENQFPVTWTPEQTALLTDGCYRPAAWDFYWTHQPCLFVMERLEADKIFGRPVLAEAWRHAVAAHPVAYLQHRVAYSWNFLAKPNQTMWIYDLDDPTKVMFAAGSRLMALMEFHDLFKPTPMFRVGFWMLLNLALCAYAWPRRQTREGTFGLCVCGASVLYLASFIPLGVASDFRYAYWPVLSGLAGLAVVPPWARRPRAATRP